MSIIRVYLDEDARRQTLLPALRARGVDAKRSATTKPSARCATSFAVAEAGMLGRSDEEHLN